MPSFHLASSLFVLQLPVENEVIAMADCGININPNEDELVEICGETVNCAQRFGVRPQGCIPFILYKGLSQG
nr:phosphate acyltransferase [Butyrivibrio sp. FCS014]